MKKFLFQVFSSCLGTFIGLSIAGFLMVIMAVGAFGFVYQKAEEVQSGGPVLKGSVLHMRLSSGLEEHPSDDPFDRFDVNTFKMTESLGLDAHLRVLQRAQDDERVQGLLIELKGTPGSWSQSQELRRAIEHFKKSGKWVMAFSETYGLKEYHLASVANDCSMSPKGDIELRGLGLEMVFMGKMLKALGIEVQVFRGPNNDYKSAVEPFMLEQMSEENREQLKAYVDGVWKNIRSQIEESRGFKPEQLDTWVKNYAPATSEDALSMKLVDAVEYRDQWLERVMEKAGAKKLEDLKLVTPLSYGKSNHLHPLLGVDDPTEPSIAVLLAEGAIVANERDDGHSITPAWMSSWLTSLKENENVAAVVLRINSPGGEALAAEQIWRELELFRKEKPLIVSMGSVVASGGYYMACAGDHIFAEKTTLTGSIGVFGLLPRVDGFLEQYLNLTVDRVHTHEEVAGSGFLSPLSKGREMDMKRDVKDVYDTFLARVAKGRSMSIDQVDEVARGRVWLGEDALKNGLVDEWGGLSEAIEFARKKAKLPAFSPICYSHGGHELKKWLKELGEEAHLKILRSWQPWPELNVWARELKSLCSGPQLRLPFELKVE